LIDVSCLSNMDLKHRTYIEDGLKETYR